MDQECLGDDDDGMINDNLSDMVSANVSGRGTPNVSGRDTPSSQVTEGEIEAVGAAGSSAGQGQQAGGAQAQQAGQLRRGSLTGAGSANNVEAAAGGDGPDSGQVTAVHILPHYLLLKIVLLPSSIH